MSDDSKQKQAADRAVEVLDGHVLFSRRCRMAEAAVRWCNDHAATPSPFSIVTALSAMGMLQGGDTSSCLRLTDAEREALERLCDAANDIIADDKRSGGCHWEEDAAAVTVVRAFLERLAKGGET